MRADLTFFASSVYTMREVARMARDRLPKSEPVRRAIEAFDQQWPGVVGFRDVELHAAGPSGEGPGGGVWLFRESAIQVRPDGGPDYLIDARDMGPAIDELHAAVRLFLDQQ